MTRFLLPVEVDADMDDDDGRLLQELVTAVLTEGFASYEHLGDLASFSRIDIYVSPTILIDDPMAEERNRRYARLKGFWRHIQYVRVEPPEPASQLGLPGLGV